MTHFLGDNANSYAPALSGPDYSEIFFEESSILSLCYEEGRVESINDTTQKGQHLRLLRRQNGQMQSYSSSSPSLNPEKSIALRKDLIEEKSSRTSFKIPQLQCNKIQIEPSAISLERKVSLLRDIDLSLRSDFPSLRQITINYSDRLKRTRILNSEGTDARQQLISTVLSISVVVAEKNRLQTGTEVLGALRGFELLNGNEPYFAARRAAQRALDKLRAPKAKAGEMPVVLSSSAGGTFIHEAIGHSLEVDHVQEGSSPAYRNAIGHVVAPENITIIDDPTLPYQRGSYFFDDEGIAASATVLVSRGVLRNYLYDRTTALKENQISNGHGRRESYSDRPFPRMSNIYIAPGSDDPALIIKSLERGLFVTRMGGGQVNTATGEFVFEVDEGYWVEGGKIRHLIRDANLLGHGPEVLRSIDRVGWDIGWGIGSCGKEGQSVPVSDGQPTIRLPKVLVGGCYD